MKCETCGADLVTTNYGNYACSGSGMPQGRCDRVSKEVTADGATDDGGSQGTAEVGVPGAVEGAGAGELPGTGQESYA